MSILKQKHPPRTRQTIKAWANTLKDELQKALKKILPLQKNECNFMAKIQKKSKIDAALITMDVNMQTIINKHPALQWAAKRV